MTSQRLSPQPWRGRMVHQRYLANDYRMQSPYALKPLPFKSKKTANYVLLVWTAVLAVSIMALYQSLQCFKGWRDTINHIFNSDQLAEAPASEFDLEAALFPWEDYNLSYESFTIRQPGFVHPKDSMLFGRNDANTMTLRGPSARQLLGRIHVIRNGTVHRNYDCGWNMDVTVMMSTPKGQRIRKRFRVMIPLLVPQSNSFQHFLDGVVPKLVQVAPLLGMPNITVMLFRPWDRVIEEMLAKFGVSEERVAYYDNGYYAADYLVNSCVTPPLHPTLWHEARRKLGAPVAISVPPEEALVVLLTRAKSRNIGRKIRNMEAVTGFLHARYGDRFMVFQGGYSLKDAVKLFGRARVVIGVHGGAFYNMFLCPVGTNIVEVIPTLNNGTFVPDNVSYNIVWKMANMLDQSYWRLSEKPVSPRGDVLLDTAKLKKALDEIDGKSGLL